MVTKRKIRNWETIKKNDGKYNSVMDEINRNYTVYRKMIVNEDINNCFIKILTGIHQAYNIKTILKKDVKFSYTPKENKNNYSLNYVVENIEFPYSIIIRWSLNKDYYWTEFLLKEKGEKTSVTYYESVLREDTISGIQGVIDTDHYKRTHKRNFKKWKSMLLLNDQIFTKKMNEANNIDNKINNIKKSEQYNSCIETINKLQGKKNLSNKKLATLRKSKYRLEKMEKKIDKMNYKSKKIRYSIFLLEDEWIEFVKKSYKF